VDDLILAGNDKEEIDRAKQSLNKTFKFKNLGNLRYFVGLEIGRSKELYSDKSKEICPGIVNRCKSFSL